MPAVMLLVFAFTLFVSASLLFIIEPMVGKMMLPLLGGTPAVWNTCMVFFQAILLAGYGFAHATTKWLGPRGQARFQLVVLVLPLLSFVLNAALAAGMLSPNQQLILGQESNPIPALLLVLTLCVGLPMFVVCTSAPLLQRWFASTDHPAAQDPYFLYGASNLGSMLALLGYPLVIEPFLSLWGQQVIWTIGYGLLAVLITLCAVLMWKSRPALEPSLVPEGPAGDGTLPASTAIRPEKKAVTLDRGKPLARPATSHAEAPIEQQIHVTPVTWARRLRWITLAMVPSSLMLGVTTYITTDLAAIPLLWVLPLALYLLTFILVFAIISTRTQNIAIFVGICVACVGGAFALTCAFQNETLHLFFWLLAIAGIGLGVKVFWFDDPLLVHRTMIMVMPLLLLLLLFMMLSETKVPDLSSKVFGTDVKLPGLILTIALHLLTLFVVGMVCHGELAADRPEPKHLTEFFLWMSFGGVVGGLFNALLAPVVFNAIVEYQLMMVVACLLLPPLVLARESAWARWVDVALGAVIFTIGLVLLVARFGDLDSAVRSGWQAFFLGAAGLSLVLAVALLGGIRTTFQHRGPSGQLLPLALVWAVDLSVVLLAVVCAALVLAGPDPGEVVEGTPGYVVVSRAIAAPLRAIGWWWLSVVLFAVVGLWLPLVLSRFRPRADPEGQRGLAALFDPLVALALLLGFLGLCWVAQRVWPLTPAGTNAARVIVERIGLVGLAFALGLFVSFLTRTAFRQTQGPSRQQLGLSVVWGVGLGVVIFDLACLIHLGRHYDKLLALIEPLHSGRWWAVAAFLAAVALWLPLAWRRFRQRAEPDGEAVLDYRLSAALDLVMPIALLTLFLGLYWGLSAKGIEGRVGGVARGLQGLGIGVSADDLVKVITFGLPAILCYTFVERWARFGLGVGALLLAAGASGVIREGALYQDRSFFGVLKVEESFTRYPSDTNKPAEYYYPVNRLVHGTTLHGKQFTEPAVRDTPLSYYHRTGPVGQVFRAYNTDPKRPYAVIGLGTGTMASYGLPGQHVDFYDIDPVVVDIAFDTNEFFRFVEDAEDRGVDIGLVLGDARLTVEPKGDRHRLKPLRRRKGKPKPTREVGTLKPEVKYALIVVDAFSSDAIPVHLITKQAVAIYLDRMMEDAILCIHISNRYLNLHPVLANIASELGLEGYHMSDDENAAPGKNRSHWVILSRKKEYMQRLFQVPRWQSDDDQLALLGLAQWPSASPAATAASGMAYAFVALSDVQKQRMAAESKREGNPRYSLPEWEPIETTAYLETVPQTNDGLIREYRDLQDSVEKSLDDLKKPIEDAEKPITALADQLAPINRQIKTIEEQLKFLSGIDRPGLLQERSKLQKQKADLEKKREPLVKQRDTLKDRQEWLESIKKHLERRQRRLNKLTEAVPEKLTLNRKVGVWTDDYSNLLSVFNW